MRKTSFIALICLFALVGAALAQDEFVLEDERATLQMEVPSGWRTDISESELGLYGIMSNSADENEARTDVQVVFRKADDLLGVVDEPIDLESENPAEDYLFKYASRYTNRREGAYDLPQPFVTEDNLPGAAMLYVERTQTLRLGQEVNAALSLSLVFFLGDDDLLIILIDTPAGSDPLADWADLLTTIRLNDESLPFADDTLAFLNRFASPESLLRQYESIALTAAQPSQANSSAPLPGENLSITRNDDSLLFSRYPGWLLEESNAPDQARLVSEDESAVITLTIQPVPGEFENSAAHLENIVEENEDFALAGDPLPFIWGELDAAIANLSSEGDSERIGQIVVAGSIVNDMLLILQFEAAADAPVQLVQDWRNTLTAIRLNGVNLPFESMLLALSRLPQE